MIVGVLMAADLPLSALKRFRENATTNLALEHCDANPLRTQKIVTLESANVFTAQS